MDNPLPFEGFQPRAEPLGSSDLPAVPEIVEPGAEYQVGPTEAELKNGTIEVAAHELSVPRSGELGTTLPSTLGADEDIEGLLKASASADETEPERRENGDSGDSGKDDGAPVPAMADDGIKGPPIPPEKPSVAGGEDDSEGPVELPEGLVFSWEPSVAKFRRPFDSGAPSVEESGHAHDELREVATKHFASHPETEAEMGLSGQIHTLSLRVNEGDVPIVAHLLRIDPLVDDGLVVDRIDLEFEDPRDDLRLPQSSVSGICRYFSVAPPGPAAGRFDYDSPSMQGILGHVDGIEITDNNETDVATDVQDIVDTEVAVGQSFGYVVSAEIRELDELLSRGVPIPRNKPTAL